MHLEEQNTAVKLTSNPRMHSPEPASDFFSTAQHGMQLTKQHARGMGGSHLREGEESGEHGAEGQEHELKEEETCSDREINANPESTPARGSGHQKQWH